MRILRKLEKRETKPMNRNGKSVSFRNNGEKTSRIVPPPLSQAPAEEAWDAWGFADTQFVVQENGSVVLTGNRYNISNVELPSLMQWFSKKLESPLCYENQNPPQYPPPVTPPLESPELLAELKQLLQPAQLSQEDRVRLRHGHGHTGAEIWAIRYGSIPRVPDLVVYPESHEQVVEIVRLAQKYEACVIPYGGGTNVTDALRLPDQESRFVISVNMRRMNRVLWIDPVNRMACIEAGATGLEIVAILEKYGMTMGHEPDSLEFSTLGGWVATHASGMKKNRYGNIEDLVLDVTVVTSSGVIDRPQVGPRESIGANPRNFIFGSEGNYGIVTSAIVKLFPLPEVQRYGSVIFPDLEAGLAFMYDLQTAGAVPASVRLMDNTQFQFGQALKPRVDSQVAHWKSSLEKLVVTKLKGFDLNKMVAATLVFEGSKEEVEFQEKTLYAIAAQHGGMKGGAKNGEQGYQLTFGIAYIRDLTFTHWAIAESFETSVPWNRALDVYYRVQARVEKEHKALGLPGKVFFTGRVSQIYQTGVCLYFYLGFYTKGVDDPIRRYTQLEEAAREEILAAGGSLSHHHGIGKIRQKFLPQIYSEGGRKFTQDVKRAVDPQNIFGASNHGVCGEVQISSQTNRS